MSIPIETNSQDNTCTPVSSNCVVWQGPNIPCIELCTGQSITIAIANMATMLCEITSGIIDISSLEFSCLVEEGEDDPETLLELLQLLIYKSCEDTPPPGETTVVPIPLPACLYYEQDGDTITSLLPNAYSAYLAVKICEILTSITSINTQLSNHNTRISALELAILTPPIIPSITITTGCASGPAPGVSKPIAPAFMYFENVFCTLSTALGSVASLQAATGTQPSDLATSPQLSDGVGSPMNDIPGWVDTPVTTADTITNIWLTIEDMRAKLATCCGTSGLICVAMPVSDVTISSVTGVSATVSWTAPAITTTEYPIEYNIEVYQWNGTSETGSILYSVTVDNSITSINIPGSYDPALNYIVKVAAVYDTCGESEFSNAYGVLRLPALGPIAIKATLDNAESLGDTTQEYSVEFTGYTTLNVSDTNDVTETDSIVPTSNPASIIVHLEKTSNSGFPSAFEVDAWVEVNGVTVSAVFHYGVSEAVIFTHTCTGIVPGDTIEVFFTERTS